jgi:outer membrane murein-binding lipoprotein Lpp
VKFYRDSEGGGFLRSLAKSAICCAVIVSLSTVAGCSDDYDDSQLRGDLSELSGRVEKLEQSVAKLNGDYTALSGIVDALEGKVYVSKVDPIADGYRITFSDGTTAEIKNGAAGAAAPVIGTLFENILPCMDTSKPLS